MSFVKPMRDLSRGLAKGGLYAVGGVAIGWPMIRFGVNVFQGKGVTASANQAVYDAIGYYPQENSWNQTATRDAAIRTGLGMVLIYAAKKL